MNESKSNLSMITFLFLFGSFAHSDVGTTDDLDFEKVLSRTDRTHLLKKMALPPEIEEHLLFLDRPVVTDSYFPKFSEKLSYAIRHSKADHNIVNNKRVSSEYQPNKGDLIRYAETREHGQIIWYPLGLSRAKEEIFLSYLNELVKHSYLHETKDCEKNANRDLNSGLANTFSNELSPVWRTLLLSNSNAARESAYEKLKSVFKPLSAQELIQEFIGENDETISESSFYTCPGSQILLNGTPLISFYSRLIPTTEHPNAATFYFYFPFEKVEPSRASFDAMNAHLKLNPEEKKIRTDAVREEGKYLRLIAKSCTNHFFKKISQFSSGTNESSEAYVNLRGDRIRLKFDSLLQTYVLFWNEKEYIFIFSEGVPGSPSVSIPGRLMAHFVERSKFFDKKVQEKLYDARRGEEDRKEYNQLAASPEKSFITWVDYADVNTDIITLNFPDNTHNSFDARRSGSSWKIFVRENLLPHEKTTTESDELEELLFRVRVLEQILKKNP